MLQLLLRHGCRYWLPDLNINDYHLRRPKYGKHRSISPDPHARIVRPQPRSTRWAASRSQRPPDAGRPAPVGFLHHGPVSAPSGGGHYVLAIGYSETHLICHDPYGELDNVMAATSRPVDWLARDLVHRKTGRRVGPSPTRTTGLNIWPPGPLL